MKGPWLLQNKRNHVPLLHSRYPSTLCQKASPPGPRFFRQCPNDVLWMVRDYQCRGRSLAVTRVDIILHSMYIVLQSMCILYYYVASTTFRISHLLGWLTEEGPVLLCIHTVHPLGDSKICTGTSTDDAMHVLWVCMYIVCMCVCMYCKSMNDKAFCTTTSM